MPRHPNVLFELGVRMAQERPVVLIRALGTPALFDVDNLLRVFEYNPNLADHITDPLW